MQTNLIERAWVDIEAAPRGNSTVTHLTDAAAAQWTGIVELPAGATYRLAAGMRHDVYVLRGKVGAGGYALVADDFLTQCAASVLSAGEAGARVLLYRQASGLADDAPCRPRLGTASERTWHVGVNARMRVAALTGGRHHVSLVAWNPDARTRAHTHPHGEEIFVLSGELADADERYPAGTWLRLHPGAAHAPFADVPTTILLRHGHLPGVD
ncbi:hypothetical protein P3T18_004243 [Paraburkholderia sp. GAS199]|uniref:cupin domain-containing protein n=1 Tax=Paraburkholderia sp. GAS199 TaxID=3035126 RepID=UPI003D1CD39C